MTKYPGAFIINEVGSRKDLASIYGVSERTIYRWLNKAVKESGLLRPKRSKRPKDSTLLKFKGTRKQLAKKYDVSERTIYRWLKKTAPGMDGSGLNIRTANNDIIKPSVKGKAPDPKKARKKKKRRKRVPYPGEGILDQQGTLKELAAFYGVSPSTISRWKRRARLDIFERGNEGAYDPDVMTGLEPPEIFEEPIYEEPIEGFEEDIPGDEDIPGGDWEEGPQWGDPDFYKQFEDLGLKKDTVDDLYTLSELLPEFDFLVEGSLFFDFNMVDKIKYLNKYIRYQYDLNPDQFYDRKTHRYRFDSEWITGLNIWGTEFEEYIQEQWESDIYEI